MHIQKQASLKMAHSLCSSQATLLCFHDLTWPDLPTEACTLYSVYLTFLSYIGPWNSEQDLMEKLPHFESKVQGNLSSDLLKC